jgi:large subunit ribosomal protein L9
MEIILLQDIDKVGEKHDIVTVKPGYGRNFLIPNKMALVANSSNRKRLDDLRRQAAAKENFVINDAKELAQKISGAALKIGAKTGTSGKIFGSITNIQIAAALRDQFGIDVDRKRIEIAEEIKEVGEYTATIRLHKEVICNINFEVVSE